MKTFITKSILTLCFLLTIVLSVSAQVLETESTDVGMTNLRTILWDNDYNFPSNINLYPSLGNNSVAPYELRAILKYDVGYTFNKTFNFVINHVVSLTINSSIPCNVYLFNTDQPQNYSFSMKIPLNLLGVAYGTASWTIQKTGEYMLLVTCCEGYTTGRCSIGVDSQTFSNVYIANNFIAHTLGTSCEYNIFTNRSNDNFRLCALQGTEPGVVVAYNDDYVGNGDFDWGNNPRIKKRFSSPISGVILFPEYKSGDKYSAMIRFADLYIGGQTDPTILPIFSNFKLDDAIRTAPSSYNYNCIDWAGGKWSFDGNYNFGEWPPSIFSNYFNPNPLTAFDNYFNSKGFTRDGATEENAAVDLWAFQGSYTHASVKNKAHAFATGYAWESKLGPSIRVMHPRYALEDSLNGPYGKVVEHYTPIPSFHCLETVLENTSFSPIEINMINTMKSSLPSSIVNAFNEKYTLMKEDSTFMMISDITKYRYSPYYLQLMTICVNNPNAIALAYEKLNEGDFFASLIIEGMTFAQNMDVASIMWNYNDSLLTNTSIRRTALANATMYSKGVIAKQMNMGYAAMFGNQSLSNDETIFELCENEGIIDISFSLQETTNVMIGILSSDVLYSKTILNKKMDSGAYHLKTIPPGRGLYTIRMLLNGRAYSKKILIK